MKNRIWELDALRGLCILGVIAVHFIFDITVLYPLISWQPPEAFLFFQRWGGVIFVVLSGICVTLGSRSVKRGAVVFGCGLVCTAVTAGMYALNMADKGIIIYFGVLHCLGVCMLLWPVFRKWKLPALLIAAAVLIAMGFVLENMRGNTFWLVPLGLVPAGFATADYFPLLPHLGFFLAGAAFGHILYAKKQTLLPKINANNSALRFLQLCGKHSLWIYLLHQPVLNGICWLLTTILK